MFVKGYANSVLLRISKDFQKIRYWLPIFLILGATEKCSLAVEIICEISFNKRFVFSAYSLKEGLQFKYSKNETWCYRATCKTYE